MNSDIQQDLGNVMESIRSKSPKNNNFVFHLWVFCFSYQSIQLIDELNDSKFHGNTNQPTIFGKQPFCVAIWHQFILKMAINK